MVQKIPTIDFFGSEGYEINLLHDGKKFVGAEPRNGYVNQTKSITRRAKNCSKTLNNLSRITKPLIRENNILKETTFEDAFKLIYNKIKFVNPNENLFLAGARLSNEELYLIQKLARAGVQSNHIDSFHYLNRDAHFYNIDKNDNIQVGELADCSRIFLLGAELNVDYPIYHDYIQKLRKENKIPVELTTNYFDSPMRYEVDYCVDVDDYYYFVKALIHYILSNKKEKGLFVDAFKNELEQFKKNVLSESYSDFIEKSGIAGATLLEEWAERYIKEPNAVIVITEQEVSSNTVRELMNLQMITGKLGFPSSGILAIKEKNNAQGLFDLGICSERGVGYREFSADFIQLMKTLWKVDSIDTTVNKVTQCLLDAHYKNIFVFGEDPIGCDFSENIAETLIQCDFLVVQDYTLTETALLADVILPATYPFETGGSFSNTVKQLQLFSKVMKSPVILNNLEQLAALLLKFGLETSTDPMAILGEFSQLFELGCNGAKRHQFVFTKEDNDRLIFASGCDNLMFQVDESLSE